MGQGVILSILEISQRQSHLEKSEMAKPLFTKMQGLRSVSEATPSGMGCLEISPTQHTPYIFK